MVRFAACLVLLLAVSLAHAQAPETAVLLEDRAFAAEGVGVGPDASFFLGSVHLGTIVRVDAEGQVMPFAVAPGNWSVLGFEIDLERRALWAATTAWPQARDADSLDYGQTALVQFDLDTGDVVSKHSQTGALGDVAVGPDGAVYTTDGLAGTVHVLRGDSLATLVPPGVLRSPQGLVFGRDPHALFLVDYRHGLLTVDVRTGTVAIVPHVPGVEDRGADGLAYADGVLYAVQNGVAPHRVQRWQLSEDESRVVAADLLASAADDNRFSEPTLATVHGNWLYVVAASGWAHYSEDGQLDVASAPYPTVLQFRR